MLDTTAWPGSVHDYVDALVWLVAVDGIAGLPEHAPYDRIIATCSVPAVPWAWAEQVRDGGLILVDVKHGSHAGNLVLLSRYADRLEGRFLPRWAGFMGMRSADAAPPSVSGTTSQLEEGVRSLTQLDPQPWTAATPWFLASGGLPRQLVFGHRGFETGPRSGPRSPVTTGHGAR
ncbi:MAG: hypothetical protein ACR2GH_11770 [Pseudonocardia sp.]